MILNLTQSNFTLDIGVYYSNPFLLETNDTLMSVEIHLSINGDVSLQQSIDGITWYDILDTTITCIPSGMQSFIECQPGMQYRLKSIVSFMSVKILL